MDCRATAAKLPTMVVGNFAAVALQSIAAGHQPAVPIDIPITQRREFSNEEDYYDAIFIYNSQMWCAKLEANGINPSCPSSSNIPMKIYVYYEVEDSEQQCKDYYDHNPNDYYNNAKEASPTICFASDDEDLNDGKTPDTGSKEATYTPVPSLTYNPNKAPENNDKDDDDEILKDDAEYKDQDANADTNANTTTTDTDTDTDTSKEADETDNAVDEEDDNMTDVDDNNHNADEYNEDDKEEDYLLTILQERDRWHRQLSNSPHDHMNLQ